LARHQYVCAQKWARILLKKKPLPLLDKGGGSGIIFFAGELENDQLLNATVG
jgi:hypothetical protein